MEREELALSIIAGNINTDKETAANLREVNKRINQSDEANSLVSIQKKMINLYNRILNEHYTVFPAFLESVDFNNWVDELKKINPESFLKIKRGDFVEQIQFSPDKTDTYQSDVYEVINVGQFDGATFIPFPQNGLRGADIDKRFRLIFDFRNPEYFFSPRHKHLDYDFIGEPLDISAEWRIKDAYAPRPSDLLPITQEDIRLASIIHNPEEIEGYQYKYQYNGIVYFINARGDDEYIKYISLAYILPSILPTFSFGKKNNLKRVVNDIKRVVNDIKRVVNDIKYLRFI